MTWPRITVVTPSFNQASYLEQALTSVLGQNYPNTEYIVMDGGSTDGSVEIIRKFAPKLAHWRSARDGGQSDAIADGFRLGAGEILGWLNSDDLLRPGALARIAEEFQRFPAAAVVYGERDYIDECGNVVGHYRPPSVLAKFYFSLGQWLPQECTFFRRSAYDRVGGLDTSLHFCMDFSLFVRLRECTRFRRIAGTLGAMRLHEKSKTATASDVCVREAARIRLEHGVPQISHRLLQRFLEKAIYLQGDLESWVRRLP